MRIGEYVTFEDLDFSKITAGLKSISEKGFMESVSQTLKSLGLDKPDTLESKLAKLEKALGRKLTGGEKEAVAKVSPGAARPMPVLFDEERPRSDLALYAGIGMGVLGIAIVAYLLLRG